MEIKEVLPTHNPNEGRKIWNKNDMVLTAALARVENVTSILDFNVKAPPYLAVGDGEYDDAPALQRAIDDCEKAGGGIVFIPAGEYKLDSSLFLRDKVNIFGTGMHSTKLVLGDSVNMPVITDISAIGEKEYAFGNVHLSGFWIDGNKANNPNGKEGIFTTAYFSTFENLKIENCQTHGLRFGTGSIKNGSSQNRIIGCRTFDCNETGLLLDVNSIDHTVSQNYIYRCNYGVVIKNGGIRIVNNDIFSNFQSAIMVTQTSYGVIIANNDINGNKRDGIHITRTTQNEDRNWSQLLIQGNTILGNDVETDNAFSGILVETSVEDGIDSLSIIANKIFSLNKSSRFQYGVNLKNKVTNTQITANHISYVGTSPYFVGDNCTNITIDSLGGGALENPPVPVSATPLTNPFHSPVDIYISGGNVTAVLIDGKSTGQIEGHFHLPAGKPITIFYVQSPVWSWFSQ